MLAAPYFSFCHCNKWKKAQALKSLCVCRTGLKALFDFETVTLLPDRLLCQQKAKKTKKSWKCLWLFKPLLTGQLKYCGMNSLDRGLCYRIIGAIIELIVSNGYSDCNGSDG